MYIYIYIYQQKTCTPSRVVTYAFAMNRICTGGIGMLAFFLSFPRGRLRGRQRGWRMLYNYCAKLGRDSAQYESCCSESCCS